MRVLSRFRFLCAVLLAVVLSSQAQAAKNIGFHFYGAHDCFPCMIFKNDHLQNVEKIGADLGFEVRSNMIERTIDILKEGAYGEADVLLRQAGQEINRVYPPLFIVTKGDEIVMVKIRDWEAALEVAQDLTR